MSDHVARIHWQRAEAPDSAKPLHYSRRHEWHFDGGALVAASASPWVVAPPWSDPAAVDPEEAFVASLSSCHLLWFLSIAATAGWQVEAYDDDAVGVLARDERGRLAITQVTLRPRVQWGGARTPDAEAIARMHHDAHDSCFIANSVRTEVRCVPVLRAAFRSLKPD